MNHTIQKPSNFIAPMVRLVTTQQTPLAAKIFLFLPLQIANLKYRIFAIASQHKDYIPLTSPSAWEMKVELIRKIRV